MAELEIGEKRISIKRKSIIEEVVDAIGKTSKQVCPTNPSFMAWKGVSNVIAVKAGKKYKEEVQKLLKSPDIKVRLLKKNPYGKSFLTDSGDLNPNIKGIIHTFGPIWNGVHILKKGKNSEEKILKLCILSCLQTASLKNLESIAIPGISTGALNFPKDLAAMILVKNAVKFIKVKKTSIKRIIFIDLDKEMTNEFVKVLQSFSI